MVRAVICDLDNTVLRTDKSMSGYTRDVFRRCRELGIRVLAASARPERTVREFGVLDEFEALVTLNGARIVLPGRVLVNVIPGASGERILKKLLETPGALVSAETGGGIFSSAPIPEWNAAVFEGFPSLPPGELYKVLASGISRDGAVSALTEDTYCTPIEGGKLWQFMSRAATKWRGVLEMLEEFSIPPRDCAFFGDDHDDIECVAGCGLGVAMGNAIPAVRAAADAVAGHCDEDGAARFIEERIL